MSMGIKYSSFADAYAHRNDPENQTPDGFFRDSSWESYWSTYGSATPENTISMEYQVDSHTFSGFEKSLCMTYDNLAKAAGTAKIILINNSFPIGDAANAQPMVQEMLDELEDNGDREYGEFIIFLRDPDDHIGDSLVDSGIFRYKKHHISTSRLHLTDIGDGLCEDVFLSRNSDHRNVVCDQGDSSVL